MPFLMSPADALFLLAERPERPLHVGTLALLNPPEGTDGWDLREMVAAAQARERVAPLWRRRPHRSLSSLGQWYWRSDAEVDLGYHVRVSALPAPGGLAELWDLVSRLHGGLLDRTRPLWQLHLIEGLADGRYAAYIKTHPALLAGVSAMRLMQQIVGTDPDRRGMHALWEVTEQTPPCDAAAPVSWGDPLDAVRGALGTAKELAGMGPLDAARGVLGAAGGLAGMVPALADTAWRAARRRGGPLTLAAPHTPLNCRGAVLRSGTVDVALSPSTRARAASSMRTRFCPRWPDNAGPMLRLLTTRSPVKAGPKLGVVWGRLDYLGVKHSVIVACGQLTRRFHRGQWGVVLNDAAACSAFCAQSARDCFAGALGDAVAFELGQRCEISEHQLTCTCAGVDVMTGSPPSSPICGQRSGGPPIRLHAGIQPRRRVGVPQRVHPDALDACPGRRGLDGPQHVARLDRSAELGGEHQPGLAPMVAGAQLLDGLGGLVCLQHRHDRG